MMVLSAQFHKEGVDMVGVINAGGVMVDANRNLIVDRFRKNAVPIGVEWLLWIDSDTRLTPGYTRALLDAGKTMVSGMYYGKSPETHPIAYVRNEYGYEPLTVWEKGELREVDGAGLGCVLTHKSVYDDIEKTWVRFKMAGGGDTLVFKDDVVGEARKDASHKNDRKVINGQLHTRLYPVPENVSSKFPFFVLEHQRTEDFWFFEKAQRAGHKLYLDTLLECGHVGQKIYTGEDYRERLEGWSIVKKPPKVTMLEEGIDATLWEAFRETE